MDFSYFAFPLVLVTVAISMYFWQDGRHAQLEKGRSREIEKLTLELTSNPDIDQIRKRLRHFISKEYLSYHDVFQPIRMYSNYKWIFIHIACAFIVAVVCSLFQTTLNRVSVPILGFSCGNTCISLILIFSVLSLLRIRGEFLYTRRIILRFDHPVGEDASANS